MGKRRLALGCLLVGLSVSWASAFAADQEAINSAIQRGVERLWKDQEEDGSWAYGDDLNNRTLGMTALSALALHEVGVPISDVRFKKALAYVRRNCRNNTDTYSISLSTVLLARVGHRSDRALVKLLAARLIMSQNTTGCWGYTTRRLSDQEMRDPATRKKRAAEMGDMSVTQFVGLALFQAQRLGADMKDSFTEVRQRLAWAQTKTGGWNYHGIPDVDDAPAMSAAGSFLWLVSSAWEIKNARRLNRNVVTSKKPAARPETNRDRLRKKLAKQGFDEQRISSEISRLREKPPVDIYEAVLRGASRSKQAAQDRTNVARLNVSDDRIEDKDYDVVLPPELDVTKPNPLLTDEPLKRGLERVAFWAKKDLLPGDQHKTLYFLWSLERLGVILGLEKYGDLDWYKEGTDVLVKSQKEDGGWGLGRDDPFNDTLHYKAGPDTCFAMLFLTKANLGSEVARLLHPDPGRPYLLTVSGTRFATLKDAVAAATPQDTIVIESDGPFPTANLVIDKPIHIQSQLGYEPVFVYQRPKDKYGIEEDVTNRPELQTMFILRAKATLEGLKLKMDPPPSLPGDWCMVRVEKGPAFLLNCFLSKSSRERCTGIMLGGGKMFLRNSMVVGAEPAVNVVTAKKCGLAIRDCIFFAPKVIQAEGTNDFNLWLVESTLHTRKGFDLGKLQGSFDIFSENNVFSVEEELVHSLPQGGSKGWWGHKNLYDVRKWVGKGDARATSVDDLRQWQRYWQYEEFRSQQEAAPYAVTRPNVSGFRHEVNPQEWTLNDDALNGNFQLRQDEQVGANAYIVGAGLGYLQFRDRFDYARWLSLSLPSERAEE